MDVILYVILLTRESKESRPALCEKCPEITVVIWCYIHKLNLAFPCFLYENTHNQDNIHFFTVIDLKLQPHKLYFKGALMLK